MIGWDYPSASLELLEILQNMQEHQGTLGYQDPNYMPQSGRKGTKASDPIYYGIQVSQRPGRALLCKLQCFCSIGGLLVGTLKMNEILCLIC